LNFTHEFNVKEGVEIPKGKWAEAIGNVVALESSTIISIFYNNFASNFNRLSM
jgi:hypothetical protein